MAEKTFDVFKDEIARPLCSEDSGHIKEKSASRILESSALACNRERLARKSASVEVDVWEEIGVDESCVSIISVAKMLLVDFDCVLVDFGVADALRLNVVVSGGNFDAKLETTDAGEA
jgi:hypothetical protein